MTPLSYRPRFPPGTRVIDAHLYLRPGYRLTLPRFGLLAVRNRGKTPPKHAA